MSPVCLSSLGSFQGTVWYQGGGALLHHLSHGLLLAPYHTNLPKLLLALLLVVWLVGGGVAGVASLLVAVVTLQYLFVSPLFSRHQLIKAHITPFVWFQTVKRFKKVCG